MLTIDKLLQNLQTNMIEQINYQYMEAKNRLSDHYTELREQFTQTIKSSIEDTLKLLDTADLSVSSMVDSLHDGINQGNDKLIKSVQDKLAHQTSAFAEFTEKMLNQFKQMGIAIEIDLRQEISDLKNTIK